MNYLTKQTKDTLAIQLVTQHLTVQIKIRLMSETRTNVLDLYVCQISLNHIMCMRLF